MKKTSNISEENLRSLAASVGGKLWIKADKIRIYVSGGNNFHYDGKWWYEIDVDGSWESKVYLTEGYGNSKREEYVTKYLKKMDDDMLEALQLDGEVKSEDAAAAVAPYEGVQANFGNDGEEYPSNFYAGCGSYYLAFDEHGKVIASVNFDPECGKVNAGQRAFFEAQMADRAMIPALVIEADGSGTVFFARSEKCLIDAIQRKTYFVPGPRGRHKNIELLLK